MGGFFFFCCVELVTHVALNVPKRDSAVGQTNEWIRFVIS